MEKVRKIGSESEGEREMEKKEWIQNGHEGKVSSRFNTQAVPRSKSFRQ